ncbi:potassium channel family protein [Streptomyces lydicamycinicus]|uniref:potassium channel family protein n=1 Tax=Streptomyces lydicamycinicus TaxID=1546107 RepID=UPI002034B28B|nr:potassium channel family protein [Streptomyces lydicamycinicus]USA04028.1 potassium channel family protein [Streptomyces lydicamycinicus]
MPVDRDARLQEWERRAQPYLFIASILFLTSYTVRVLIPGLSPGWYIFWETLTIVSWGVFVAEYLARLALSRDRWHFVRTRWLDLIVTVLPLLRPLRMIDLHERMQLRRAAPGLALEARVMTYSGLAALLLGYAASLAVYHDERSAPHANIRTFGDAVWWAASTLTTTGYGDATPVTARGRVIAVGLMFVGVALVGAVVGSFSAYLMRRFRQEGET